MSLPEPNFIERDPAKITQELIETYERITGKKLYPAQIERLLIDLIAYRETLVRIAIQEAAKQNLVEYARFPMLDYLGELVGVYRLPAQPARTTLRFYLSEPQSFDVLIPQKTQVETKDGKFIFETDKDVVIKAGELYADVSATCTAVGSGANGYLPGQISELLTPLAYISKVENISVSLGGADMEDDERLRQRIKEAPERFSNAGSRGAYKFWAMLAHQDIVDVAVLSPSPGVVSVYVLTKNGDPTPEILSAVAQTLNDEKVRPLTDMVQVLAATRIDFQITANITLYKSADAQVVQSAVLEKLNRYASEIRSKLGRDVVRSQIIALINGVRGVYKTELISPSQDIILENSQYANCTTISINITGAVDG
ncbi:MAG: baseplate J/gp47 family protein [Fervidobacterium sp.]|nr:baseplate J/gp47 family protein [Fervidobacterium sp.]